jgi:hypothetical protein
MGLISNRCLPNQGNLGIHYLFATQTTQQMRDESRRIFNDRIAFGNCSHIFSFRISGEDSEKIAINFGDQEIVEQLVRLDNYKIRGFYYER